LTTEEVWKFCALPVDHNKVKQGLKMLVDNNQLVAASGFWALKNRDEIIVERQNNLALNVKMLKRSRYVTWVLKQLPFVKGIGISGSLSKQGATPGSDIDFFIITAKNRVWLVKAMAILIKKIFLFNSHKYLCVNYLVSEDNLQLNRENRFQAIEAITLKPVFGGKAFHNFFEANNWIKQYFPNQYPPNTNHISQNNSIVKALLEWLLKGTFGDKLEKMALNEFRKFGYIKHSNSNESKLSYAQNESIYFPNDFEQKVLKHYEQRIGKIEKQALA
ncbi:MAG: nucleotidyltransferase domain-containing protein, partial [Bacteroidia bacterium]